MKKLFLLGFVATLFSCQDSNLKKLEAKADDSKCKLERMQELMKLDNILAMSISLNLEKEYNEAFDSFGDSTLSCEQANKKWDDFMKKYDSAQTKSRQ